MDEGYGLSSEAVENCLKKFPVSLLLAVDCGSTSVDSIRSLNERGVDVIVLDHHQISSPAPAALALVNPQRQSDPSNDNGVHQLRTFTELCSVSLAFKLAHAIVKRGREVNLPRAADYDLRPLLDLVALGTIADVVPLTGENRILVTAGLERLNTTRRAGLTALKRVAQSPVRIGTYEVGFQLAPRLNAAGRLETAEAALNLLLAQDMATAMPLAQQLDAQNRERQKIERGIAEEAIASVRAKFKPADDYVIVEGQMLWHIGVVGIVASRVLQQFYRPTIIVGGEGSQWRGSGRSIAGFDLAAALRECGDLLIRHGGHAMAAGVSIPSSNLDSFRTRLNDVARRMLKTEELQPSLQLDAEVGFDEITLESLATLDRLKPVGQGNAPIQFVARNLAHQRPLQRLGNNKQHVKMWLTDGGPTHEAVWWGAGQESLPVGKFDLAFAPKAELYNGRRSVQLKVLDWRAA
jgi:single-stranded-DNA-specific exonuclease